MSHAYSISCIAEQKVTNFFEVFLWSNRLCEIRKVVVVREDMKKNMDYWEEWNACV
jgi:hypothetical protein